MAGYLTQAVSYYGLIHLAFYTSMDILKAIRDSKEGARAAHKAQDSKPEELEEELVTTFHIIELWLTKW